jgi:hypothetical protein
MRWPSEPLPLSPSDGRLGRREWLALGLVALALTVLVVVTEPGTFGSLDWVRMHSLYKAYSQSSVAAGRLPLWNPYHWLGRPFLADIESAFFYPPEALYLLLDVHIACALTCALHLLLLLYGTVKLARALGTGRLVSIFVACAFAASAPIVGCFTSGLIHYGQALCYAPLVLYLGMRVQAGPQRRVVALLGLVLGLQVLCGHPQAAWLTEVGLVVFLVGRRLERPLLPGMARLGLELLCVGAALGLGLALAAVALLPLAELAGQSNRPEASVAFAALFSEPLYGWATLLVPTELPYFGFQANGQLYAGVVPFLAGVCGLFRLRDRNVRALLVLALFAAVLAAGQHTPFFALFFHTIPGLGWLRIHSRATVLVTLALVLAAGLFFSRSHGRRMVVVVAVVALLGTLASVTFCLAWPGYGSAAQAMALGRGLAVLVAGVLLVLWLRADGAPVPRARLLAALLVALTAIDLTTAARALKQDNRETITLETEVGLRRTLVAEGLLGPGLPPPRVFVPALRENAGMVRGFSTPYGYSALAPGRMWRHMHERLGVPIPVAVNTWPSDALAEHGPIPYDSMALVMGTDPRSGMLVAPATSDPRAYVATTARLVRDDREATALMRAGHDFHKTALVESPLLSLPSQPVAAEAKASITHFAPERISVVVESAAPGLLVLAEPWFPGWSAVVNGAPAPCVPANAWMRAVPVPAGGSEVALTFRSTYLAWGAMLSLLALAAIAGLLLVRR